MLALPPLSYEKAKSCGIFVPLICGVFLHFLLHPLLHVKGWEERIRSREGSSDVCQIDPIYLREEGSIDRSSTDDEDLFVLLYLGESLLDRGIDLSPGQRA